MATTDIPTSTDTTNTTLPTGTAGGGGGGLTGHAIDTYANLPATGTDVGEEYYSSDSPLVHRWNGTSWDRWHPVAGLTEMPETGWTKYGSPADPTFTYGGLQGDGSAQTGYLRASTSGDIHTFFSTHAFSAGFTIAFYDSISTRATMVVPEPGTSLGYEGLMTLRHSVYLITFSSLVGSHVRSPPTALGGWWLQLEDDGVNIVFRISANGQDWTDIYSEGRTAFLTNGPDYIGVTATEPAYCTLWHYKKT